jgi:phage shock protein A
MKQEELATVLVDVVKKAIEPLKARNAELEARIKQLEARPMMKWAGVHVTGTQYAEASLVTRSGSLWAATKTTSATPGDNSGDWRLIVKKGHA